MTSGLSRWEKLKDKGYREQFVVAQAKRAIPFQIRMLMKAKEISQQQLAERSGLTQGVISRAANPAYGNLSLNTILRVAAGLDVAFIGAFVPFSKLVDFYDTLSGKALADVPTFEEEDRDAEQLLARHDQGEPIDHVAVAHKLSDCLAAISHDEQERLSRSNPPLQQKLDFEQQRGIVVEMPQLEKDENRYGRNADDATERDQRNKYADAAAA